MKMILTALEPEDLELLYNIENDASQWSVSSVNVPYSRYSLHDYISNQSNDIYADKQVRLVVRVGDEHCKVADMKAVGLADLFNFSPEHMRAEVGIAVMAEECGKGYGTKAIQMLKEYAFNVLHLHTLYAVVPFDNAPSLALLRACGFNEEILLREWLRDGDTWKDAIQLLLYNKK